jgi:hypothetical protein
MAYDDLFNSRSRRDNQSGRSLGNIDPANPHFISRLAELRELHAIVSRGQLGVIAAVQGRGGLGTTALAIQYAHVFANEYGGGCWQVQCAGQQDLVTAVATLAWELRIEFNDAERLDSESRFQRVLTELRRLTEEHEPHRCLLLLDDIDRLELVEPRQIQRLLGDDAGAGWLQVIATTRVEEKNPLARSDRAFLSVTELPEADAVALIESFQPNGKFANEEDLVAAREIVNLLGGFTLAIEVAAAFLGHFAEEVTFADFILRLRDEGLALEVTSGERLDQKRLIAALLPIVGRLTKSEVRVLIHAAASPSEQIILPQLKWLTAPELLELADTLVHRFIGLRLWQPTSAKDDNGQPLVVRMHPLLQDSLKHIFPTARILERTQTTSLRKVMRTEDRTYSDSEKRRYLKRPAASARMAGADEARAPAAPKPLDDNVMFTVYRRKTVAPGKWYPLLAFAHLSERRPDAPPDEPDPLAEVERQAQTALGKSIADYKQSTQDSTTPIPRSGELTFKPYAEGVEFNPPTRSFRWEEPVHREEFKMRAAAELDGQTTRGWLRVYLGPLIIAQVNLTFTLDSRVVTQPVQPDDAKSARPLRKVFASYSHKDKPIVEYIEKIVSEAHLGIEYLRDATKLRSGEVWNDELMRMIDAADMFQLFWSTNSMGSKFVRQEYQYALSRSVPDFVRPVYWEKPFPERPEEGLPPEELRRLHFEEMSIAAAAPRSSPPAAASYERALLSPTEKIEVMDTGETFALQPPAPELAPARASSRAREIRATYCRRCGQKITEGEKYCRNCGGPTRPVDRHDLETTGPDTLSGWREYSEAPSMSLPERASLEPTIAPPVARSAPPLTDSEPMQAKSAPTLGASSLRPAYRRRSVLKIISVAAMLAPIILAPVILAPLLLVATRSNGPSGMASGGASLLLLLGGALLFLGGLVLFVLQRNR